jgi:predicted metal-binding membrane protein
MDGTILSSRGAGRFFGFDPHPFFQSEVVRFAVLPSAVAWLTIVILPLFGSPADICSARPAGGGSNLSAYLTAQALWCLMVLAMMLPLSMPQLKNLAARSATGRKGRTVALFVFGFVVAWTCVGFLVTAVTQLAGWPRPGRRTVATLLYFVAIVWQVSTAKKRSLNRCHFVAPVRALGRTADGDALRNGLRHGRYCVGSCLLTMLPLSGSGLGTIAMIVVFALILAERADHRPKLGLSAGVIFLLWANEMV